MDGVSCNVIAHTLSGIMYISVCLYGMLEDQYGMWLIVFIRSVTIPYLSPITVSLLFSIYHFFDCMLCQPVCVCVCMYVCVHIFGFLLCV